MTKEKVMLKHGQRGAVDRLHKAFQACADAGLRGGVFSGFFCVWPADGKHPLDTGEEFFSSVEKLGGTTVLNTHGMNLDGGAGN